MNKIIYITFIFCFFLLCYSAFAEDSNFSEHIKVLEEKCYKNDYLSCYVAGQVLEDTNFILLAISSYEKACNNGIYESCVNLGKIYVKDYSKAIQNKGVKLLNTACDNNIARGCANLGNIYYKGTVYKKNYKKAKKYYDKACVLHDNAACFNLGVIYQQGTGVKKDNVTALKYYKRACQHNFDKGCEMYEDLVRGISR